MGCMGEILLHSHSFGVLQPAYLKSLEKTLGLLHEIFNGA